MKNINLILIITILSAFSFSPINNVTTKFYIIEYDYDGRFSEKTIQRIETKGKTLDLHFYNDNFSIPFYLPKQFIDKAFKNEVVQTWARDDVEKNIESNWVYTKVYDSLSRVIRYSYSGCLICSNFPYDYRVFYNSDNRVIKLVNNVNGNEKFEMKYNRKGHITKLKFYTDEKLKILIKSK